MTYISAEIRWLVAERAGHRCEYCLIHEDDTFLGCEVDHIISKKHGGSNEPENLAYACLFYNRHKGTEKNLKGQDLLIVEAKAVTATLFIRKWQNL